MVVSFLSTANAILSSQLSPLNPSSPTSSSSSASCSISSPKTQTQTICQCRAFGESSSISKDPTVIISKRNLSLSLAATLLVSLTSGNVNGNGLNNNANAAILEADDDLELLERVKKDRQKRIEKQGVISSSKKETGYLQDLVYKLSEVGQAIEKNDLGTASSVLGPSTDKTDWIKKANSALSKLSSSPEEKEEVDIFNTWMEKLITFVDQKDVESSKIAFVSSASAFEKWTTLTGLVEQLKGL